MVCEVSSIQKLIQKFSGNEKVSKKGFEYGEKFIEFRQINKKVFDDFPYSELNIFSVEDWPL